MVSKKPARVSGELGNLRSQLAAVSRSMAIIEFALDGTVLDANQAFLTVMGYSRDEIIGKHHRIFVDPAYAAGPEYATFWSKLRSGESHAGEFPRLGRGGRSVWIQATYAPLLDATGKPARVMKFATDITARRDAEAVFQPELERVLKATVAGDFTQRLDTSSFPEGFLRNTGDGLNRLVDSLNESFRTVKAAMEQISQAGVQLRTTSQMMSTSSLQLRAAAEGSSQALGKASDGLRTNAENAAMANQLVAQTAQAAESGQARMGEMSAAIGDIEGAAGRIAKIIKVIDEIAFQTNLLALNAAVEAARAGRHGKGFAVVAQEVRTLAERSARAAKETAPLIEDTVAKVQQGVRLTEGTRAALGEITRNVEKVVDLVGEIDSASGEQAREIRSVSGLMGQVTEGAQAGSQQSAEVAAAAEELGRQMEVLKKRIDQYKVRSAPASGFGVSSGLPPQLLEQIAALVRAQVGAGVPPSRWAPEASVDPRAVLPLDRDERGYGPF